ncbi:MAG: CBM35 domain-containing protein [Gemmatimonadota bacterium]
MRVTHLCCLLALPAIACSADRAAPTAPADRDVHAFVNPPPAASVTVPVNVPASMQSAPFNVTRFLTIPPNFAIAVYTRIAGARFMAVAPNGDLLVAVPGSGKVVLVRPNGSGNPLISDFVTGLAKPHDIVFHPIGATTYLYIAEKNQINRYAYTNGDLTGQNRQIILSGLPDESSPGLGGTYGHVLKNIALDSNDKLYVSIASTCNVCLNDTQSNPVRGAIYQYNADGTGGVLFARGLRNAEGLAMLPGTTTLWAIVNNRDDIPYPFNDGSGNYGQVITSYVDNHPPEEFTRVRSGGNYGWPFCNPNPDSATGYVNMPFDLDYNLNQNGSVNCASMDRISMGIQAHSAPLGLLFLQNTAVPAAYQPGAVAGLHGSWNRSQKTGYKVIYFPWDNGSQLPATPINLVTGWLQGGSEWGRPVDIAVNGAGDFLISDDASGTIYKMTYTAGPPPPPSDTTYEAEMATLHGAVIKSNQAGFTGTGFVHYVNATGDYIEWTFTVPATDDYNLSFRYGLKSGTRSLAVAVNGVTVVPSFAFAATGSLTTWKRIKITRALTAGPVSLRLSTTGQSGPNVDNVRVFLAP